MVLNSGNRYTCFNSLQDKKITKHDFKLKYAWINELSNNRHNEVAFIQRLDFKITIFMEIRLQFKIVLHFILKQTNNR